MATDDSEHDIRKQKYKERPHQCIRQLGGERKQYNQFSKVKQKICVCQKERKRKHDKNDYLFMQS